MSSYDKAQLPKSVKWHPLEFADYMLQMMGSVNAHVMYDHFFLFATEAMAHLEFAIEALEQGALGRKSKKKIVYDKVHVEKLKKIWNGGCYIIVTRHPEKHYVVLKREISFNYPENMAKNQKVVKVPALKKMNPSGQVKSTLLTIRIREAVGVPEAIGNIDYQTLGLSGKFVKKFADKTVPIFKSQNEVNTFRGKTSSVSRTYFHTMIDWLVQYFYKYYVKVFIRSHLIVEADKLYYLDEEHQRPASMMQVD